MRHLKKKSVFSKILTHVHILKMPPCSSNFRIQQVIVAALLVLPNLEAVFWGDWGRPEVCPSGTKAVGFTVKVDRDEMSDDRTGLNALSLRCSDGTVVTSLEGPRGEWTDFKNCPEGSFIITHQLLVEPVQLEGDDTAANNVNILCSNGDILHGDGLANGVWSTWTVPCSTGVCGLSTRVDLSTGPRVDQTGLNDVFLTCCP